jgi:hypothetical protein
MTMTEQRLRGLVRVVDLVVDGDRATMNSLIEWETVTGVSAGAGATPRATTADGDDLTVLEPYGFASSPPGDAQTLALAVGGDDENRAALGLSVASGRPATDAGDTAMWTGGGHSLVMDDEGGITLTAKDGSSVVLSTTGSITINAGPNASITINVDAGQVVDIGQAAAERLLEAPNSTSHLAAALRYGTLPGNFAPNDGGVLALTNAAAFIDGTAVVPPAIPGNSLTVAAGTEKARGT